MKYVDLHLHTNYSDGSDPPERVVARAAAIPLAAIAFTDHDTLAGIEAGQAAAAAVRIGFLPATEISAVYARREVHVLGLGIDPHNAALAERLAELQTARNARADRIMDRLHAAGIAIDPERVRARAAGGVVGRMHIARELREMGLTKSTQAGFDQYLNYGRLAYVQKALMPALEALSIIHEAAGLAFVAHPGLNEGVRKVLPHLLELPFDGLEAYHISHSPGYTSALLELAAERELLVTGGSDCHGTIKGEPEMGKVMTPFACYERILRTLPRRG